MKKKIKPAKKKSIPARSRRDFIKTGAAAGAGLLIVPSATAFGSAANSSLGLGIIGCGTRGANLGWEILKQTDARVTGLMDIFDDRLEWGCALFDKLTAEKGQPKLSSSNLFRGWRGYQELVQSREVDVALIASPPYFHPDHFEAAAAAGKHVYLETPVASDVSGCLRILETARGADGKLTIHVGLPKRYDEGYREMIGRIQADELGGLRHGQGLYDDDYREPVYVRAGSQDEARLRNWRMDRALSGDFIARAGINVLDVLNWAFQTHPIKVHGFTKRYRDGLQVAGVPGEHLNGDCYILTYDYPDKANAYFFSIRFGDHHREEEAFSGRWAEVKTTVKGPAKLTWTRIGSERYGEVKYCKQPIEMETVLGKQMKAFVEDIRSGRYENQAERGVDATLTAIMGRMVGDSDQTIHWDEMIRSGQKWDLKFDLDRIGAMA